MNRFLLSAIAGILGLLLTACEDNSKPVSTITPSDAHKTTHSVPASGDNNAVVVPDKSMQH